MTPRPKTDQKKELLFAAAIRVFAAEGLTAPTAAIAREAGVANGTLFNNFATKADLLSQLYLELKVEVMEEALRGLPLDADLKKQAHHVWTGWTRWGAANPHKRRTLSLLCLSDEISGDCLSAAQSAGVGIGEILSRTAALGHLRDQPMAYVMSVVDALAGVTIDSMIEDPDQADRQCDIGFETFWRALS
jgi:AcrR family transcriptional regulator